MDRVPGGAAPKGSLQIHLGSSLFPTGGNTHQMSSNLHPLAHNHPFRFPSIPKPNPSVGQTWLLPETSSFTWSNHSLFLYFFLLSLSLFLSHYLTESSQFMKGGRSGKVIAHGTSNQASEPHHPQRQAPRPSNVNHVPGAWRATVPEHHHRISHRRHDLVAPIARRPPKPCPISWESLHWIAPQSCILLTQGISTPGGTRDDDHL